MKNFNIMILVLACFFLSFPSEASVSDTGASNITKKEMVQNCLDDLQQYVDSFGINGNELIKEICYWSGQELEGCTINQEIMDAWVKYWVLQCLERKFAK